MKRRMAALVLCAAACLSLCAPALAAEEASLEERGESAVAWEELEERVRTGSLNSRALTETIGRIDAIDYERMEKELRKQMSNLLNAQWASSLTKIDYPTPDGGTVQIDNPYYSPYTANTLKDAYDSVQETANAIRDGDMQADNADAVWQIEDGIQQIVAGSQELYLTILDLERTREDGERGLAALDRSLTELRLRQSLGQVSRQQVESLEQTRASTVSQLKTLDNAITTCKLQLQVLIGEEPTGELTLAPLPEDDGFDRSDRSYAEDLAAAKAASWTLRSAQNTLDDAREDWEDAVDDAEWDYLEEMADHAWNAAQATYAATVLSFETSFRSLYDSLADYQQAWEAKKSAVTYQEKLYANAQMKFERGMISRNALLSAQDDLESARSAEESAWRDLFSARNSYRNAVEHGLLGGSN